MSRQDNIIYGLHAVAALLERAPDNVQEIWVLQGAQPNARLSALLTKAKEAHITVHRASRDELDAMVEPGAQHQGVIARQQGAGRTYDEADLIPLIKNLAGPPFLLILDGVQDPHNLGACLRTADAAGVHAVIAPKDRAASLNATVRKVACGAAETVPFISVTNLARTLRELKEEGIWLVGADMEGSASLYETDMRGPLGLVMGAEGSGLRRLTREHCDFLAQIPLSGTVQSLNVSVAAGIFMFEAVRQRGAAKAQG